MQQGMGRAGGQDRKGTSRVGKAPETRRAQQGTRPATGRMNVQGARGQQQDDGRGTGRGQAPGQDNSKTTLYIGIGVGAVVFAILIAVAMSGGGEGGHGGGGGGDTVVNRAIAKATEAYQRGEYRIGLDLCEDALKDPKARKSSRYSALQALANQIRQQVNLERDAAVKVEEFKRKVEASKQAGDAMKRANEFWAECNTLLGAYQTTPSGKILRDIKEDLRRWVATESQGDWQKDYNVTKARIEKSFLGEQKFAEAIREWQRFGETSQDPLLRSRIEQEIRQINLGAQAAAEKLVAEAGTGAEARAKLEEAQARFNGSDGLQVINKAIKGLK